MHVIRRYKLYYILFFFALLGKPGYTQEEPITEVRYYGTGCFTIQRGDVALFTDPFISNPTKSQVLFGKVQTDKEYVDTYINPATFRKVRMVIAGHAHYDHLLDMPYLSKYIPESALIATNKTAKHILAYYNLPQQTMVVNDILGNSQQEGYWVYSQDETMRVMAFRSQHPPHFAGINLMNKKYAADLDAEPEVVRDWQEGKTLAFLVDWMEEDTVAYRVYFSSSLAKQPFGLFPKQLLDEHPVDDLFISAALFSDFDEAPKPIIDLCQPKRVILMHWENFFRSKEREAKALNEQKLNKLIRKIQETYGDKITLVRPQPLGYY